MIAGTFCDPAVVSEPDQAPEAVQLEAAVVDHDSVGLAPLGTAFGLALRLTAGGVVVTVTVTELLAAPPAPVQARLNCVVALSATVFAVPLVGCGPLQPPKAVHTVALVADQVRAVVAPALTVGALAEIVTVGTGCVTDTIADCDVVPPEPLQDTV